MSRRTFSWGCIVLTGCLPALAAAELPLAQLVTIQVHEIPDDPSSPLELVFSWDLDPVARDGSSVGWLVVRFQLQWVSVDSTSTEYLPWIDTPDGLWWVTHGDPLHPEATDFSSPPPVAGIANVEGGSAGVVEYDVDGQAAPTGPSSPFPVTSLLSYHVQMVGASDPPISGDDDPAEVPDPVNDPHCVP